MEILEEKLKRETNQWKRAAEVYFVFLTFVWDRFYIRMPDDAVPAMDSISCATIWR